MDYGYIKCLITDYMDTVEDGANRAMLVVPMLSVKRDGRQTWRTPNITIIISTLMRYNKIIVRTMAVLSVRRSKIRNKH